jgi:hypothetical protein
MESMKLHKLIFLLNELSIYSRLFDGNDILCFKRRYSRPKRRIHILFGGELMLVGIGPEFIKPVTGEMFLIRD